jgi:hypothetical protein
MVEKNEKVPTYEEFIIALRKELQEMAKGRNDISDETMEEWLEDYAEGIRASYQDLLSDFESGKINRHIFLAGGVNAVDF